MGNTVNTNTIDNIKAKIICGAANNQLESPNIAKILHDKNILYVPDYLINRMGIVNCANEMYGHLEYDEDIEKHFDNKYTHSIPSLINLLMDDNGDMLSKCDKLTETYINEKKYKRGKQIMNEVCNEIIKTNEVTYEYFIGNYSTY